MEFEQLIERFEEITNQMDQLEILELDERVIDEIEALIQEREEIIKEIDSLNEKHTLPKDKFEKLMTQNKAVEKKLLNYKIKLVTEIENVINQKAMSHMKKKATRGYLNYGNQSDGFFIDKKK